jgi:hypothetical protein
MKNKPFYLSDEHTRSFGGKLNGFETRDEAMKEKKHLKAYLAGKKIYRHGYKTEEIKFGENTFTQRTPVFHEVIENWTPKTQK